MRFFEEQRKARKASFWLITYFLIFVLFISFFIGLGCAFALGDLIITDNFYIEDLLYNSTFQLCFFLNALAIIGISIYRTYELRDGNVIATKFGGTLIFSDTKNEKERRLLNVVEEMSLASGVTMPMVYVLKDQLGVNAFAAGWEPRQATIAVTQGALNVLDRDELQGVIAHEFSHILNGDMALNMKITGVISGLVFLTELGGRAMFQRRRRSSSRKNNGAIPAIGAVLYIVGGIGVLGSKLIQSAISRQREYLADASSAQFTRNPNGLARALAKIHYGVGSIVKHAFTNEASHLFFSNPNRFLFFATHPPLEKRIFALDKNFNLAEFEKNLKVSNSDVLKTYTNYDKPLQPKSYSLSDVAPASILASIGNPNFLNFQVAKSSLEKIPESLLTAARGPTTAGAVILGLILKGQETELRNKIIELLKTEVPQDIELTLQAQKIALSSPALSFVLLQICVAALRQLEEKEKTQLLDSLMHIFDLDSRLSFSEALVGSFIADALTRQTKRAPSGKLKIRDIRERLDQFIFWSLSDGRTIKDIDPLKQEALKKSYYKISSTYRSAPAKFENFGPLSFDSFKETLKQFQNLDLTSKSRLVELLWKYAQHEDENARIFSVLVGAPVPPFVTQAS